MPELSFRAEGAGVERFAAVPCIDLRIGIDAEPGAGIRNVMLQCQIRIEATRRHYADAEKARLVDLFGEPGRWSRTLQGLLWTHVGTVVPAFEGGCVVPLHVPCSFDFNVAATKYCEGLDEGEIPLLLLFSGAVFHDQGNGLQISQIGWDKEVRFRLPVAVWKDTMAHYYPDSAWLRLPRSVVERLAGYKQRHGLTGFEQALEQLLADERAEAPA